MDIETLIRESHAEKLTETLGFQTKAGKERFLAQLRLFSNQHDALQRRKAALQSMRDICKATEVNAKIQECFQEIGKLEADLQIFFTKSDVEKDSYEQLTFSGWAWAQILNTIPFVLLVLSYFKLYAVPFFALLTPVFILLMPYIALRYWYEIPIETDQYIQITLSMFGVSVEEAWSPKNIVQGLITLFSVVQSVVQPIQNAIHLQTIHSDLVKRGAAIERLAFLYDRLLSYLPISAVNKDHLDSLQEIRSVLGDTHRNFADVWDHPFRLRLALQNIGDIETLYRLAAHQDLQPVKFVKANGALLLIEGGVDPFLEKEKRVAFEVCLTRATNHHAILTGPNRGGKSSVLRSTLLSVLMAQTFGFGFHTDSMVLRPFDWVAAGLRLEDRPGKTSMFEREVEFAIDILRRASSKQQEVGLVLFDELFHSTNPPDGARTAAVFLEQIWQRANIVSFISTHVFELARAAPGTVQKLCVPAYENEDGTLVFTYSLKPGICEVSSVNEILKEKGLIESR